MKGGGGDQKSYTRKIPYTEGPVFQDFSKYPVITLSPGSKRLPNTPSGNPAANLFSLKMLLGHLISALGLKRIKNNYFSKDVTILKGKLKII